MYYPMRTSTIFLAWPGLAKAFTFLDIMPKNSEVGERAVKIFLESLNNFRKAQCYFNIPIALATCLTDLCFLDPLNGYGLLLVSMHGFLVQSFTLLHSIAISVTHGIFPA